jgi:hypothetical protein
MFNSLDYFQARAEGISASTTQANWPEWEYDAAHSGFNPNEKTLSPSNIFQLTLDWEFTSKASFVSSPIVANGVVYYIEGLYLYGRDALTGARKMTKLVRNQPNFTSLSFSNGLLYIGISQGLIAINATTSRTVWQFTGSVFTDPVVAGNFVYFIGGNGGELTLYGLNAATGAIQWSYTYTQQGVATPAVANGIVYLTTGNSLYALNAVTGAVQWTYTIQSGGISSPAIVNGIAYCYCGVGLAALDAATGTLLLQQSLGSLYRGTSITSPAIVNGMVYITTINDWTLYAFHLPS